MNMKDLVREEALRLFQSYIDMGFMTEEIMENQLAKGEVIKKIFPYYGKPTVICDFCAEDDPEMEGLIDGIKVKVCSARCFSGLVKVWKGEKEMLVNKLKWVGKAVLCFVLGWLVAIGVVAMVPEITFLIERVF